MPMEPAESADSVAIAAAPAFNPKDEPGVTAPFGFFDPLSLCPDDARSFYKIREAELKHGRVAMLAFAGFFAGEVFQLFYFM